MDGFDLPNKFAKPSAGRVSKKRASLDNYNRPRTVEKRMSHDTQANNQQSQSSSRRNDEDDDVVIEMSPLEIQIQKNKAISEMMSPITKYKVQEYVRKNRSKSMMQRRKFSLLMGLPEQSRPPPQHSHLPTNAQLMQQHQGSSHQMMDQHHMGHQQGMPQQLMMMQPLPHLQQQLPVHVHHHYHLQPNHDMDLD